MKNYLIAIFLLVYVLAVSQNEAEVLNSYKYAVVPSKFSFLSQKDQYSINTYTKMYMEKYGFVAFMDTDTAPAEAAEKCSRVYVDLDVNKNMFITKLNVILRDCVGNVLYISKTGSSRQKDYKISYREALREAFGSLDSLGYKYNGGSGRPNPLAASQSTAVVQQVKAMEEKPSVVVVNANTLFAQPVENGYQLVNTVPSVVFKLRKTSSNEVYIAEKGSLSGTMLKKGNTWIFEYYQDGKLVSEEVSIKF